MRIALVILLFSAFFISGCENSTEQKPAAENTLQPGAFSSQAAQAAAKADETLKTVTAEAEKSTEEINKKLPSIIESINKLIVILKKESETLQKELDKLPKQTAPAPAQPTAKP